MSDNPFSPNKTSARFLVEAAATKFPSSDSGAPQDAYLLIYDLYIKARSYAIINKIMFWLSILFGILVLIWPALSVLAKYVALPSPDLLSSTVVQTSVTALAALAFMIYSHYKKQQMMLENLMRLILLSDEDFQTTLQTVITEMQKIDLGFAFDAIKSRGAKK